VFSLANQHIAIIPQIESQLGIQNLDEIVALAEVDAFMIGREYFNNMRVILTILTPRRW
jgi:2-keto-3-deoxy-L-rhamnonate aldolase RhmA